MDYFSYRNGYVAINFNQLHETSMTLRERIWTVFYKEEYDFYDPIEYTGYTTGIEDMMIEMGIKYEFPNTKIAKDKNADDLHKYVVKCGIWYRVYDFIEKYLKRKDENIAIKMTKEFNRILEEEIAPYRILNGVVVPIVNRSELDTLAQTINLEYESVSKHMSKAVELYSDRQKPDYENTVKESISAVEAMCCIITGERGRNATLGNTLKKLKDSGVIIHSAMEGAFLKLYGYTSDSGGIRHGSIDFVNVESEDAKYMMVSCAAFINYLIEKWVKV